VEPNCPLSQISPPKHIDDVLNAFDQKIGFGFGIVKSKRGSGSCRNVEPRHHRLRAMVAGSYRNAVAIQNRPDIMGMNAFDHE
jgi:hypothetical protein